MLRINDILVARDFSPCSEHALYYALRLAQRTGATVHLVFAEVLHGEPYASPVATEDLEATIREQLQHVPGAERFGPDLPELKHAMVRDLAAAPAILEYAEQHGIDLIVMGTHGRRGVRRWLLGSVAEEVVRRAPCPVLTVQKREGPPAVVPRRLLVPVDFSKHARAALHHAKEFAALYDARLDLVHVVEEHVYPAFYDLRAQHLYGMSPDFDQSVAEMLAQFYHETAGPDGDFDVHVLHGHAARKIVLQADEGNADLIVMPTHGLTGLSHFMIGSVAEKVVRTASCPVLTLKSFGTSLLNGASDRAASSAQHAAVSGTGVDKRSTR